MLSYFVILTKARNGQSIESKTVVIYGLLPKREVKMAGYWPHSFFCVLMDLDFVSV